MKPKAIITLFSIVLISCSAENRKDQSEAASLPLTGTWKLLTGTLIEKGDTVVTDYTKNLSFIKIINDDHFAFLQHNLNKGKDSTKAFEAGGGRYSLKDSNYTEHLEYCSAPEWEGHDFTFTISIKGDTLTQSGIEKVEGAGVNRTNIERYVRLKN